MSGCQSACLLLFVRLPAEGLFMSVCPSVCLAVVCLFARRGLVVVCLSVCLAVVCSFARRGLVDVC